MRNKNMGKVPVQRLEDYKIGMNYALNLHLTGTIKRDNINSLREKKNNKESRGWLKRGKFRRYPVAKQ